MRNPTSGCWKSDFQFLTTKLWKLEVGNRNPNSKKSAVGSWIYNSHLPTSNFQMLDVGSRNLSSESWKLKSKLRKLNVECWIPTSGSLKLDSRELVWTSRLNTFSAQNHAEKREKTAVFKRGNLLEETPVGTRGDPRGPVGARAAY